MSSAVDDSSDARSPWWRRRAVLAGVVAAAVVVSALGIWAMRRVMVNGTCAVLPDGDRTRIGSALMSLDVPNEAENLGVYCDYGEFSATRTCQDSAATADLIEQNLVEGGWIRTPSNNRAFCLPGEPYLYAVIVPAGTGTWRGAA